MKFVAGAMTLSAIYRAAVLIAEQTSISCPQLPLERQSEDTRLGCLHQCFTAKRIEPADAKCCERASVDIDGSETSLSNLALLLVLVNYFKLTILPGRWRNENDRRPVQSSRVRRLLTSNLLTIDISSKIVLHSIDGNQEEPFYKW